MADPASPVPVLYSFRRCPYAMRARLALYISGQPCHLREVALANKPAQMLELSPKGTVPVLALGDGRVVDESLDIMRWALGRNDPQGWLAGGNSALIARNDGTFKHHLDRYKYPSRYDNCDGTSHRDAGLAILAQTDAVLAAQPGGDDPALARPQLGGAHTGLADMAIFPFVRQFANTDRAWFDAQPIPHVQKWLSGHLASDIFAAIMAKFVPWAPGDPPIIFRGPGAARAA